HSKQSLPRAIRTLLSIPPHSPKTKPISRFSNYLNSCRSRRKPQQCPLVNQLFLSITTRLVIIPQIQHSSSLIWNLDPELFKLKVEFLVLVQLVKSRVLDTNNNTVVSVLEKIWGLGLRRLMKDIEKVVFG
ncbi:hypothetical protein GIB67_014792, partial [Kingdonia uniflora]